MNLSGNITNGIGQPVQRTRPSLSSPSGSSKKRSTELRATLDRLCAGRRRHPEDIRHHKAPHPGVQLGGAHRDFGR
jgi:hypothetical protein